MKKALAWWLSVWVLFAAWSALTVYALPPVQQGLTVISNYGGAKGALYVEIVGYTGIETPQAGDLRMDTRYQGLLTICKDGATIASTPLLHTTKAQLMVPETGWLEVRVDFPVEEYDGAQWVSGSKRQYLSKTLFHTGNMTEESGLGFSKITWSTLSGPVGQVLTFTVSGVNQGAAADRGAERFLPTRWELLTADGTVVQTGTFSGESASYSATVMPTGSGLYHVKVYFNWQQGNGSDWVNYKRDLILRSETVTVTGDVAVTTQPPAQPTTPLPTRGQAARTDTEKSESSYGWVIWVGLAVAVVASGAGGFLCPSLRKRVLNGVAPSRSAKGVKRVVSCRRSVLKQTRQGFEVLQENRAQKSPLLQEEADSQSIGESHTEEISLIQNAVSVQEKEEGTQAETSGKSAAGHEFAALPIDRSEAESEHTPTDAEPFGEFSPKEL